MCVAEQPLQPLCVSAFTSLQNFFFLPLDVRHQQASGKTRLFCTVCSGGTIEDLLAKLKIPFPSFIVTVGVANVSDVFGYFDIFGG